MCIALFSRWLRLIVGMVFCAATLAVFAQGSTKEKVRAELIRLQKQSGLTLISFEGAGPDGRVYIVAFANRSLPDRQLLKEQTGGVRAITSDGTEIAFEGRRRTGQTLSAPGESKFAPYRTYLGVIRRDGSDLREYLDLDEPSDLCWSPDGTALALNAKNLTQGKQAPAP